MSAPNRPPSFFNALTGKPLAAAEARREPGFLLDDLAADVAQSPDWVIDDGSGRVVHLRVAAHRREEQLVVGFTAGSVAGTLTAVPDPSGFLRVEVRVADLPVFTGYLEQIWEEYEIWPPGAAAEPGTEAPGRLGKRRNWVSLDCAAWPALAGWANAEGWLNLMQCDA